MTLNIAKTLSTQNNPLGFVTGLGTQVSYLSQNFSLIVQSFTAREDIYIDAPDCGLSCTTVIQVDSPPSNHLDLAKTSSGLWLQAHLPNR
jgi:hypothetical protein